MRSKIAAIARAVVRAGRRLHARQQWPDFAAEISRGEGSRGPAAVVLVGTGLAGLMLSRCGAARRRSYDEDEDRLEEFAEAGTRRTTMLTATIPARTAPLADEATCLGRGYRRGRQELRGARQAYR